MSRSLIKLLFFVLSFFGGTVNAQFKSLQFDRLTTDDGLSQSTITCIFQDYQGFMWFGTYDGLNKFDAKPGDTINVQLCDTDYDLGKY